ncbi:MAG: DnaA regulatory inactivator Hda [Thiotrichaceae bacterium]|nr:DnaA regulatory inactivator Hda [Thiotrichaceae bacterium]PCI14505.1 MAG: DnaA regulatory inactivator Hda [Thiotrichales bacterium]
MAKQLPLSIRLRDHATFKNFSLADNQQLVTTLQCAVAADGDTTPLYLWGASGCGKSHLMQAACHQMAARDEVAAYLPLRDYQMFSPEILDGMESLALVCVDDIEAIAGLHEWEEAIFHLYNRMQGNDSQLVVAANAAPQGLALVLPDLMTRLGWGLVFQLNELNDEQKVVALQARAEAIGMQMNDDVARYLFSRTRRDMHSLFSLLEALDDATLVAQRRLTIPFLKAFLALDLTPPS